MRSMTPPRDWSSTYLSKRSLSAGLVLLWEPMKPFLRTPTRGVGLAVHRDRGREPGVDLGERLGEAELLDLGEEVLERAGLVAQRVPVLGVDLDGDVQHPVEGEVGVRRRRKARVRAGAATVPPTRPQAWVPGPHRARSQAAPAAGVRAARATQPAAPQEAQRPAALRQAPAAAPEARRRAAREARRPPMGVSEPRQQVPDRSLRWSDPSTRRCQHQDAHHKRRPGRVPARPAAIHERSSRSRTSFSPGAEGPAMALTISPRPRRPDRHLPQCSPARAGTPVNAVGSHFGGRRSVTGGAPRTPPGPAASR